MKKHIILSIIVIGLCSCQEQIGLPHKGTSSIEPCSVEIDTLLIPMELSSGYGNYYMKDSTITFVDAVTCVFYDFDLKGNLINQYFRKGNGKND